MCGLGGIFVEVMKDVAFHLAPITADEALQMLSSTRSYALLRGARGQRGVDIPKPPEKESYGWSFRFRDPDGYEIEVEGEGR